MSLSSDIKKYKNDSLPHLEDVRKFYEKKVITDAIQCASTGTNTSIKMDPHQRRVGKKQCSEGAKKLLQQKNKIINCKSFEEIFVITEQIKNKTFRLGNLWSYDTALRIGFNKKVYPEEVYIQAGVIKGAKKGLIKNIPIKRSLPLSTFRNEIQTLKPYEAENFLCIWGKDNK